MFPTFGTILWTLLLLVGASSQVVQQYFPRGKYLGRQWVTVAGTQPLDGEPPRMLITRTQQGFLVFNWSPIADTDRIPVTVMAADPQQFMEDGGSGPQSRVIQQVYIPDAGLPGLVQSQTGPEAGNPVEVDAEENNVMYSRRKRDIPWKFFNGISQRFFSDGNNRGNKPSSERRTRGRRSAFRGPPVGIAEKRIIPVKEETRYRRGTDDNLSSKKNNFRSARNVEPRGSSTQLSFDFPILTRWFRM